MAHPVIRPRPMRSTLPRAIAIASATGALLLAGGPAAAAPVTYSVGGTCEGLTAVVRALDAACEAAAPIVAPVEEALAPVVGPVTEPVEEAIAPVVEQVEEAVAPVVEAAGPVVEAADPVVEAAAPVVEAVAPVTEALPGEVVPGAGGGAPGTSPVPLPGGGGGAGSPGGSTGPAPITGNAPSTGGTEVAGVGKDITEVAEPAAPAAKDDARATGGPAIKPTDLVGLGGNIAGIGSQSGVTLQPYDAAPLVSFPTSIESPQVAGAPVTTASPVAALATDAFTFAGDMVLPQTTTSAAWLTVAGLSLMAGTGYVLRRRSTSLTLATLDGEIF